MTTPNAPRRPAEDGTAPVEQEPGSSLHIVPPVTDPGQVPEIAAVSFVALVETRDGRLRRQSYFNLESARRAVERAHLRGVHARVLLCSLVPVREVDVASEVPR